MLLFPISFFNLFFVLAGSEPGEWYLDMASGKGAIGQGAHPEGKSNVHMSMKSEDFNRMFKGKLKPTLAFMSGKLKIKGDMGMAMKLEKLMGKMQAKLWNWSKNKINI